MDEPYVCFTLDLEEDISHGASDLRYDGLQFLPDIVERFNGWGVPLTVFVAGNLLQAHGPVIEKLSPIEFHSHGMRHEPHAVARQERVRRDNMREGVAEFERFFGRLPLGYRGPYGFVERSDFPTLRECGVKFDASFFSGVHVSGFHLFRSIQPHYDSENDIIEIPVSSIPGPRFPYSLSYMNLFGSAPFCWPVRMGWAPRPLVFDFHLHDMAPTRTTGNPGLFWNLIYGLRDYDKSWALMGRLIDALKSRSAVFLTMGQLHQKLSATKGLA